MSREATPHGGRGSFTGTDRTGTVTVTLDEQRRVDRIDLLGLPDELRDPALLVAALGDAYLAAVVTALDTAAERAGKPLEPKARRPVAATEPTRSGPTFGPSWGHASDEEIEEFRRRVGTPSPATGGPRHGVSDNGCVEVTLHATDHFGDLTIDPGWLRHATTENVQRALDEAFERANEKGD